MSRFILLCLVAAIVGCEHPRPGPISGPYEFLPPEARTRLTDEQLQEISQLSGEQAWRRLNEIDPALATEAAVVFINSENGYER